MKRAGTWLALAGLAALSACARPTAPLPAATDDFVFPAWEQAQPSPEQARDLERAWRELTAGKTGPAERRLSRLLADAPGLVPVRTALAYASLRAGRLAEAASRFAAVLGERPNYLPALIGSASAARRRADADAALGLYRRAAEVAPDDALVQRRLAEVKLQVTEAHAAAGRAARAAGDVAQAVAEFRHATDAAPELGPLRVELADALLAADDPAGAIAVLREAPTDEAVVLVRLAELLSADDEIEQALRTYRRALVLDPDDAEVRQRAEELSALLEQRRRPPEYQRIPTAPRVSRADLAALLALKLTALDRLPRTQPPVAVDLSGSWARPFILELLSLGILDVYPNHTFQPGALVRRGELGDAVGRVLGLFGRAVPEGLVIGDMSPRHRYFPGVSRVVDAGLMSLSPAGAFEPWRPVSGREAMAVVEGAAREIGP